VSGDQLTLGRHLRDVGMAQAAEHAGPTFREWAADVIGDLASRGEPFTSDHLEQAIEHDPNGIRPDSRNAIGAAFGAASRRGVIEPVGYTQSQRPEAHARVVRVWRGTGQGQVAA
jgi:hypothetical protein